MQVRRSQKHHRKSSGSKELKVMMCSGHDYISGAGGGLSCLMDRNLDDDDDD